MRELHITMDGEGVIVVREPAREGIATRSNPVAQTAIMAWLKGQPITPQRNVQRKNNAKSRKNTRF